MLLEFPNKCRQRISYQVDLLRQKRGEYQLYYVIYNLLYKIKYCFSNYFLYGINAFLAMFVVAPF